MHDLPKMSEVLYTTMLNLPKLYTSRHWFHSGGECPAAGDNLMSKCLGHQYSDNPHMPNIPCDHCFTFCQQTCQATAKNLLVELIKNKMRDGLANQIGTTYAVENKQQIIAELLDSLTKF